MTDSSEKSAKRAHSSTQKTITPVVKVENRDEAQENGEETFLKRIRTSPPNVNNNLFCFIQCQLCGFPFMDVASLQAHTITVHTVRCKSMSNSELRKYRQAFIEAYNIRFSDVEPPLRQIAAENLFNSISSEDQLKSTMADLLKYSKKLAEASTSKFGDKFSKPTPNCGDLVGESSQDTLPFSDSPSLKNFLQSTDRSRERPAQEKLQREIQTLDANIFELQSIKRTRELTPCEVLQLQDSTQQRDELQKKLKKTMDAAIRAKRYRIRKAAHHGAIGGTDSDGDSYPEMKRQNYSQDLRASLFNDSQMGDARGVLSVASAESDTYSAFSGSHEIDSLVEITQPSTVYDTRSAFGSTHEKYRGDNNNEPSSEFNLDPKTSSKNIDQYICNQCDMAFDSFNNFIGHMRSAHLKSSDPDLRCRICQASFANSQTRLAHLLEHFVGTNTSYSCHQCPNKHFETSQQFRQHFVSFHTDVLYRCAVCLRIFSQNSAYQEHIMAHAVDNMQFQCVVCNLTFETHELLMAHVQLVHDRDESAVVPNNNNRRKPSAIISPMNGHATIKVEANPKNYGNGVNTLPQKGLKCFVCDLECPDENSLDEHRLFNHCKIPKGDRCAVCHMTLHSYDDFVHHTQLHSTGLTETSCVICRQTIRGDAQLKMHGDYHLNNDDIPTKCAYCDKHVPLQNLPQHIFEHTMQIPNPDDSHDSNTNSIETTPAFICHCGQQFEVDSEFHAHALEHIKDLTNDTSRSNTDSNGFTDKFKCPKCPKSFPSLSALQGHSHVHMGTRNFKCDQCTHSFTSLTRLDNHKKKHQIDKEIKCQICDERFMRSDLLQMHMRIHEVSLSSFIAAPNSNGSNRSGTEEKTQAVIEET